MTATVYVGSKSKSDVMVSVEGSGMTQIDARRNAIQVARSLYRIMDPIALNEHEAAVRMRRQVPRPSMQNLNGCGVPFWRQRDSVRCYK